MILNTILQIPVPRDIQLGMPLPHWLLVVILIFSFLLHILFINLMLGGTLLTLWYEIKGIKEKRFDKLAKEIAATITVNKSLAVVLGVAPLLSINVLYTIYFYSANALTGLFWLSIIPWVAVAFLILYLHKYSWEKLGNNKSLHIGILSIAALSFLFIPFIFLANINLMLFPERWESIHGFFTAMFMPSVFPRYFHFLTASLAITGLFLFWYVHKQKSDYSKNLDKGERHDLKKRFFSLTFGTSLIQFIFGPLLLLTLPTKGVNWNLIFILTGGITAALLALNWMWKAIRSNEDFMAKYFNRVVIAFTITVLFMGWGRHAYRANALEPHQEQMAQKTLAHQEMVRKINALKASGQLEEAMANANKGEQIYNKYCAVCHSMETRLVGPPIKEVKPVYADNIEALKAWIKEPGRKRMDYPPMAGFPDMPEEELELVSNYILELSF